MSIESSEAGFSGLFERPGARAGPPPVKTKQFYNISYLLGTRANSIT